MWEEPCKLPGLPVKRVRGQDGEEERGKSKANPSLRAALPKEKGWLLNLYFSLSFQRSFNHEELYNHNTKEYTSGRTQSCSPGKLPAKEEKKKQTEHAHPPSRASPAPTPPSVLHAGPFMPASARPPSCSTRAASCPVLAERPTVPVKASVQLFSLQMDSQEHLQLSFEEPRLRRAR